MKAYINDREIQQQRLVRVYLPDNVVSNKNYSFYVGNANGVIGALFYNASGELKCATSLVKYQNNQAIINGSVLRIIKKNTNAVYADFILGERIILDSPAKLRVVSEEEYTVALKIIINNQQQQYYLGSMDELQLDITGKGIVKLQIIPTSIGDMI